MPFVITRGLGEIGDGSMATLLGTRGYGDPNSSTTSSCLVFKISGIVPDLNIVDIFLTTAFTASGPAIDPSQYFIVPLDGGGAQDVLAVEVSPSRLRLITTEHKDGALYQLTMPNVGIISTSGGGPFQGPFVNNYIGVGEEPGLVMVRVIDARLIEVIFNEPVVDADALDAANYVIAPPLAITGITKVNDTTYRIATERQIEDTVYTITSHNIRDDRGNQDT